MAGTGYLTGTCRAYHMYHPAHFRIVPAHCAPKRACHYDADAEDMAVLTWCAAGEGVVATMAIRVNAAQAACLLGRGEKTVRAWFRDGVIRGAEKVSRPGQ